MGDGGLSTFWFFLKPRGVDNGLCRIFSSELFALRSRSMGVKGGKST